MKRPLKAEEVRLWTIVASTVRPDPGRNLPEPPSDAGPSKAGPTQSRIVKKTPLIPATRRAAIANAGTPLSHPPRPIPLNPRLREDEQYGAAARKTGPSPHLPDTIEPLRKRRIARERDPIGARLDMHGLDQDRARVVLHAFLHRAHREGMRAVLVITGKGALGDGVLRRRTPDWLSEPPVRALIAGFSPAEPRHGGDGALYIALKRRI